MRYCFSLDGRSVDWISVAWGTGLPAGGSISCQQAYVIVGALLDVAARGCPAGWDPVRFQEERNRLTEIDGKLRVLLGFG